MAQRVLGDGARFEELKKVIRAAGLGADAGKFEAAEGLAFDYGAGDLAVEVKIAHAEQC